MIIFKSEVTIHMSGLAKVLFSYKDIPIYGTCVFNSNLNFKTALNYLWRTYTFEQLENKSK